MTREELRMSRVPSSVLRSARGKHGSHTILRDLKGSKAAFSACLRRCLLLKPVVVLEGWIAGER